jgi:hypothetical protein
VCYVTHRETFKYQEKKNEETVFCDGAVDRRLDGPCRLRRSRH